MDNLKTIKPKIKEVFMDDASCDKNGIGIMLYVYFDNGAGLSFPLDSMAGDSLLGQAMKDPDSKPKTDGERLYWSNWASLTIEEMLSLVLNGKEGGCKKTVLTRLLFNCWKKTIRGGARK